MALEDKIIGNESGGDPNAKNERSSASGAGQFIDSTWLDMLARHRPDLTGSREELLALKADPALSRQMTAAYASDNQAVLAKNGLPVTPGTTYLAHFAGPQGAVGLLNADPSASAESILGPNVVKANPFLAKMSAGDVTAWAGRKMGDASAAPMSMAGPRPAPAAPSAPADLSAARAQAADQAPAAVAAPMGFAPRSAPVNLAALAATPKLNQIHLRTPNPYGLRIAPFSLGG